MGVGDAFLKIKIVNTNTHFILTESEGAMESLTDVGWYKVTCRGI